MDPRRLKVAAAAVVALPLAGIAGYALRPPAAAAPAQAKPDPRALADAALLSLRDEGRLVVYAAGYVAAVPGDYRFYGVLGPTTFIVPGTVRYSVDLTRLRRSDLSWDAPTRTLTVTLPPLDMSAPALDLAGVAEAGTMMLRRSVPLQENPRRAAIDEIVRQARQPAPVEAARAAAMRLVASSFAMPLRAAGVEASVAARFIDPSGKEEAAFLDRPRRLEETLRDRAAGRPAAFELANSAAAPK
jgi:hypothetical protein